MVFDGVRAGPFLGREAIRAAYEAQPPTDEVRLLGSPYVEEGSIVSGYAWAADGRRAGRLMLHATHGAITRLIVTFEPPPAG